MIEPFAALFVPLIDRELDKTKQRILDQIRSITSLGKAEEAVEGNRTLFGEHLLTFAMSFEPEFTKRTKRSFDESSDEEIGRLHRLLAGALFEIFDEINPERIKMLSSALVGGTWGNINEQLRSAAWRAIKRLEPESVVALRELQDKKTVRNKYINISTNNEKPLPDDQRHSWLAMLEGTGCIRTLPEHNKAMTRTGMSASAAAFQIYYVPQTTEIGKAVLEMLKTYLNQPLSSSTNPKR